MKKLPLALSVWQRPVALLACQQCCGNERHRVADCAIECRSCARNGTTNK